MMDDEDAKWVWVEPPDEVSHAMETLRELNEVLGDDTAPVDPAVDDEDVDVETMQRTIDSVADWRDKQQHRAVLFELQLRASATEAPCASEDKPAADDEAERCLEESRQARERVARLLETGRPTPPPPMRLDIPDTESIMAAAQAQLAALDTGLAELHREAPLEEGG